MHEIRATILPQTTAEAVRLAREAGIERVTVADVYVHGPDAPRQVVAVETSTPKARAYVEALLAAPVFRNGDFSLTSRELRAIVASRLASFLINLGTITLSAVAAYAALHLRGRRGWTAPRSTHGR